MPHVNHVFIIVLENENADSTFGPHTAAPYLAHTLRGQGAFLPNYYAIGHESLDNYIAMVSGQAPNTQTQADCMVYTNFKPGTPTSDGQYRGTGCVYPAPVATIANQLEAAGHTWKGYMDDMKGTRRLARTSTAAIPRSARGRHPDRRGRRPVRGSPQPLRLLPLDHRLADLRPARRRLRTPELRPAFEADDPQLLVHHPEPLPRRPRLAVRQRRARWPRDGGRVARRTTCRRSSAPPRSATEDS